MSEVAEHPATACDSKQSDQQLQDKIGLAVGKHMHTIVTWNEGKCTDAKVRNALSGFLELHSQIGDIRPKLLIIAGNRRWALPMGYALVAHGIPKESIRYLSRSTERGKRENTKKFLQLALTSGATGRPMFDEKRPNAKKEPAKKEMHSWYQIVQEYRERSNECRRLKHRLLSELTVLFPECVRPSSLELKKQGERAEPLPPDIWTKKMTSVLECPDPVVLKEQMDIPGVVRGLAEKSLGRFIPAEVRAHHMALHAENLKSYREAVDQRDEALERVRAAAGDHPVAKHFEDSESALVLAGLIGWRKWPWRELRSFAGLAVTRVDSKGNPRISRVRGEIRQYLYILRSTKLGKDLCALSPETIQRLKDEKKRSRLVKEEEKLLKKLWQMFLR